VWLNYARYEHNLGRVILAETTTLDNIIIKKIIFSMELIHGFYNKLISIDSKTSTIGLHDVIQRDSM